MTTELPEREDSLWYLAAAPLLWAMHFLACYATAAVWCAKAATPSDSLAPVQALIGVYSVAALIGIALVGWRGWKHHRYGRSRLPHDQDSPADRHRFLGFATSLLSGLSALAVLYQALPAIFIGSCR